MKTTITIESDGWVHITHEPAKDGVFQEGLGDLGVDVEIVDKRKVIHRVAV
jgi:hypothetical protein